MTNDFVKYVWPGGMIRIRLNIAVCVATLHAPLLGRDGDLTLDTQNSHMDTHKAPLSYYKLTIDNLLT